MQHHRPDRRAPRLRLRATAWATLVLLGAQQTAGAQNLPVPCAGNICMVPNFVSQGLAGTRTELDGTRLRITQQSNTALLNWSSFNIANGHSVLFEQPGANAVAINRIHDVTASRIDGNLSANGQVYLINPNGLLFGNGARVDVAGLIASTLDIAGERLERGLLGGRVNVAAFALGDNPLAAEASVRIAAGAAIRAGNVYVFAPNVANEGAITVNPGGQVVLAAGQRVFLAGSDTATLRGLLVEVGQGGTVTNSGQIATPRGNTTLVGMAVNQAGRITATSAINENGSIRLLAREVASTATQTPNLSPSERPVGMFLNAAATGTVDLKSGSETIVALDAADRGTAPLNDANAAAARSAIVVDGAQVRVGGSGAGTTLLQAHGGDILLQARTALSAINSRGTVLGADDPAATLTVGSDARIDASGERDVAVDGNRDYVEIERLTSNDMRDVPLQRDGFLRGQRVHVNVARDHAFIDLSARRAAVAGTQAERNAAGGNIALRAEGRVDVAAGARLDVSGGTTITSQASGRTSQLISADGRVVDVMDARADERYVGFADRLTHEFDAPREGLVTSRTFEAPVFTTTPQTTGGRSAGSVEISAPRGTFAGTIEAGTSPGAHQRASLPAGGELRVNNVAGNASIDGQIAFARPHLLFTDDLAGARFAVPGSQADQLIAFETHALREGGVSRIVALSDGAVTVTRGAAIDAGPGGSITLQGNTVDVDANLSARGGSIVVSERSAGSDPLARAQRSLVPETERGRIRFGRDVVLDASGLYTSDLDAPAGRTPDAPIVRNGGSIAIAGRSVDLSSVARVDLDAGASVSRSGSISGGRGGTFSVSGVFTDVLQPTDLDPSVLVLGDAFADRVSGFGFSGGGTLTLGAPRLVVGGDAAGALRVEDALFDRGFQNFSLLATDRLDVLPEARIEPQVRVYALRRDEPPPVHGADISAVLQPHAPLPADAPAMRIDLQASRTNGSVTIGHDAVVDAGTQGTVQVNAGQAIVVEGRIAVPGGNVNLALGSPALTGSLALDRLEQQAIQLADGAVIDVSGVSRVQQNAQGRRSGAVLDGGSVSIAATRGSFSMDRGARIDARGASDAVDLPAAGNVVRTTVASRGGALSISAQQSLFVEGAVSAGAGGAGVEGGRLSVRFDGLEANGRSEAEQGGPAGQLLLDTLFRSDRTLTLSEPGTLVPLPGARFGAAQYAGRAHVSPSLVNGSGFDSVWLGSGNTIEVPTSLSLATAGSLTLDTQALRVGAGAALDLQADTLALGFQPRNDSPVANLDGAASAGSGRVDARARHIDLVGALSLQGVGSTTLAAQDDVRLRGGGLPSALRPQGRLSAAGDVAIVAAQLTPASMTDYTIELSGPASRLSLRPSGQAPLEPLSAAGSVTLKAPQVEIAGRVSAPHGVIDVQATTSATLAAGAELSVAGHADVPLGTVFNGAQWVYADDPNSTSNNLLTDDGVALPVKRVRIDAPTVDVSPEARLDVSGGGNLVAQEFVAGPGGSRDLRQHFLPVATGGSQRNTLFALVPARGDAVAPFDPHLQSDLTTDAARGGSALLRIGQTLTLGAGSEIPAGTYTVLPVRYALLPGAYALQAVAGYADLQPGSAVREAAGTVIVAGRSGIGGAGDSAARWSGYRVYNGAQLRRHAELREYGGNDLVAAAADPSARAPIDAGALSVAGERLRLASESVVAAAGGVRRDGVVGSGHGAQVSIAAPHIVVTDQAERTPATPSDTLVLNARRLSDLQAQTLVLGAAATRNADGGLTLDTRADTVSVGGAQALTAGELLLAARARVDVNPGASLQADAAQQVGTPQVQLAGDGAALLVSSAQAMPVWTRNGAGGDAGDLAVAQGARVSGRSVLFDASRDQQYAPSSVFDAVNLGLSSARVHLGDVPAGASGLVLGSTLLSQFAGVENLAITSGSDFDLWGDVSLGGASLRSLTLNGGAFVAHGGSARFAAGDVTLRNTGAASAATGSGGGMLTIEALDGDLRLAGGAVASAGFDTTALTAAGELRFDGSGSLAAAGDLVLDAGRITGGQGADHAVNASGMLHTQASVPTPQHAAPALGARLALAGRSVEHHGRIDLPSGALTLAASGTAAIDDVTLAAGSRIGVAGSTQSFASQAADASAGQVTLRAAGGSVRAHAGSTIDIGGAGRHGDAGALSVVAAQGSLQLDGELRARPGSAARGAEVTVDVGQLPDLATIAHPLAGAQALQVDVRVRRGDVQLAAGDTLSAQRIRIAADGGDSATRAADGQVRIAGTLDASGDRAGRVELHARDSVSLAGTARIVARSSGALEEGGSVLLSARIDEAAAPTLDAVRIEQGARVDVSGGADAAGGTVTLRAPLVGSDVAIQALPQYLDGARAEVVEATLVRGYAGNLTLSPTGAVTSSNPLPGLRDQLQASMSAAHRAAMSARLDRSGAAGFHLRPGLEIRADGNIAVGSAIDFSSMSWRYGGADLATSEPGAFTLRAAGNVTLTGGLLDGFRTITTGNSNARLVPFDGSDSWRYQLTAGADHQAAAAATTTGSAGNVVLAPINAVSNAVVRTGTGRIDIAAANDIELRGANAALYTGGTLVADAPLITGISADFNPRFTQGGGGVTLEAGRDVFANTMSNQLVNNWLWRAASPSPDIASAWWVNAGTFLQGVGALGGGDLVIDAGRDVRSLTAVVPTNGHTAAGAAAVARNGGALDVRAARAIEGGLFYAERGTLDLRADEIGRRNDSDLVFLAQGDNTARVQARGEIDVFGSFNPTWAQPSNLFEAPSLAASPMSAAFSTYGEASALDLRSLAGDVLVGGGINITRVPTPSSLNPTALGNTALRSTLQILPGSLDAVAFGGDVLLSQPRLLAPAARGQLRLLADGDVSGQNGQGQIVMAALALSDLPSVAAPSSLNGWRSTIPVLRGAAINPTTGAIQVSSQWGLTRPANHGQHVLHEGDAAPAQIVARSGDIHGLIVEVPKPLVASAGGDVRHVTLRAQNLDADSLTQVHAGGRIRAQAGNAIVVTGPGSAEVLAGAEIDLGASDGLVTRGNLVNPHLGAGGATLIAAAGLGRGSDGFVQQPDYANVLRRFVRHDAFAAAGTQAAALNAQVLEGLDAGARAALQDALADRAGAGSAGSAFDTWLSALPPAQRARTALALAERVQAVVNERFVATRNTDTFAAGYHALHDLFPVLSDSAAGLRHFVTDNPLGGVDNGQALRSQALQGLPDALRAALEQGLAAPESARDPASAFNQALAAIAPEVLADGSRQLVAQVNALAGRSLDSLRASGRVNAGEGTPFARGLDAMARAFSPAGPSGANGITLVFSQVKAEQSGSVVLLAPRGGVIAGVANPPAGATTKGAQDLGVLTLGGGDITGIVRDNFDVYRSRVFTVAGGDVHLWAGVGNIDAGRGPRDVAVAPPPRLVIDTATGLVSLDVTASVSGSGIGALKTLENQPRSDIRLIAPNGFIDAGEAGIRAESGTVTLGTNIVLNAGNIAAGGGVAGGAVVVAPTAPVPTSAGGAQADKAVEQANKSLAEQQKDADERAKKERRRRVTGEFLGFGEGN